MKLNLTVEGVSPAIYDYTYSGMPKSEIPNVLRQLADHIEKGNSNGSCERGNPSPTESS